MTNFILRRRVLSTIGACVIGAGMSPLAAFANSDTEFRIGALNPLTGAGGPYGEGMLAGIKLAVEEVNSQGGAGGRQLKLFAQDSQTKPDAAVLAAKKLIEINNVSALVGTWASSVTLAIMPLTSGAGIIQMNSSGAPEVLTEDKDDLVWGFQSPNTLFGWAFAEAAATRGFTRPATMAFDNASALGQAEFFQKAWKQGGGSLVGEVVYQPNQTSYRTELQNVLATKPDVVILSGYTPDATIILREWYQDGTKTKFIMPGWSASNDLIKALGPTVTEGIISVQNVVADDGKNYGRFTESYKKANGQDPDIYAAECYDMIITLALAIEAAGDGASVRKINDTIRTVTNAPGTKVSSFAEGRDLLRQGQKIDYDGVSSKVEMSEQGVTIPDFGVFEIESGKLVRKETIVYKGD